MALGVISVAPDVIMVPNSKGKSQMKYQSPEWLALPVNQRPSFYELAKKDLCEIESKQFIGKDPRDIPRDILEYHYNDIGYATGCGNGKVVRLKCLDCCAQQQNEVRCCTALLCPLWPYRMGTNPFTNRKGHIASLRAGRPEGEG